MLGPVRIDLHLNKLLFYASEETQIFRFPVQTGSLQTNFVNVQKGYKNCLRNLTQPTDNRHKGGESLLPTFALFFH